MFARRSRTPRRLAALLAGLVVLLVGVWLGGHPGWIPVSIRGAFVSQSDDGKLVDQVMGMLSHDYYRKVDTGQLVNRGLSAAVASLDDPYSHYFSPSDYHSFQSEATGSFGGIGVTIQVDPRGLLIDGVMPRSPAARTGLRRGEVITAVGSVSLAGRSQSFSAAKIQGRPGTTVRLTVRAGAHSRTVSIRRAQLSRPIVASRLVRLDGKRIGVVALSTFEVQGAGDEVRARVRRLLRAGARGLVLDLRDNGGGLLQEAVKTASIFIPDGTIVSTSGRTQPRQVYLAKGGAISTRIPLVVLVDHGTASASEIVTAALQDRKRAKVIGTHTYGKGVFQEIQPLPNGGALDITVGEYFTPSGRNLGGGGVRRGAGVTPNVFAPTNPRGRVDTALRVAERAVAAEVP